MSAFADVKDDKTLNEWLHEIAFVTSTMSDPDEPQSFQEAWWDPDLISREKWKEAIRLELKKMLDMGVWRHVRRNDGPNDRRLVGCMSKIPVLDSFRSPALRGSSTLLGSPVIFS